MFVIVTAMSHFISCVWHYINILEERAGDNNTWLINNGLNEREWYIRYIESFYFTTAIIMLIGTKGNTSLEVLFVTFTLFFTVGSNYNSNFSI